MKALTLTFNNSPIHISHDAWFNATDMAKVFNKRPTDWLKQKETKGYIALLCKRYKVTENHFIKTQKGKGRAGTWLHRKLAIRFAQWLSAEFAIWCDEVIEEIISGERQQARNDTKASNRLMNKVLHLTLQSEGKEARHYHYSNNVMLCYEAMTGERLKVDRDSLPARESKLLAEVELDNTAMTLQGMDYHQRKAALLAKYSNKLTDCSKGAL